MLILDYVENRFTSGGRVGLWEGLKEWEKLRKEVLFVTSHMLLPVKQLPIKKVN